MSVKKTLVGRDAKEKEEGEANNAAPPPPSSAYDGVLMGAAAAGRIPSGGRASSNLR